MGKGPVQTFHQRRHTNGQWIHEKMFKITTNQGNAKPKTPRDITSHVLGWLTERDSFPDFEAVRDSLALVFLCGSTLP